MPIVAPFRGVRYNAEQVKDLAKVVTPPYDVISPQQQRGYYSRHKFNFIRIVYGRQYPTDNKNQNRYSRARHAMDKWIRAGVLISDSELSVYPYLQEYHLNGRQYKRWGVIALVRLDSPAIYPHEETRTAPKQDRVRLLKTVQASVSPLFGLIPDKSGSYQKFIEQAVRSKPACASVRFNAVVHRLWKISDPVWIRKLQKVLRSREMVIADGHHRFEAAKMVRQHHAGHDPNYSLNSPYNFSMFYLSCAGTQEPGLLPTHRLLSKISQPKLQTFLNHLLLQEKGQKMESKRLLTNLFSLRRRGKIGIGLYAGTNGDGILLNPPRGVVHRLDVEWLHGNLLPDWIEAGGHLSFTQDLKKALDSVKQGRAQLLFVMQPPDFKEVFSRARSRVPMPGKTTYFYPKPLSGLVQYLWGGA